MQGLPVVDSRAGRRPRTLRRSWTRARRAWPAALGAILAVAVMALSSSTSAVDGSLTVIDSSAGSFAGAIESALDNGTAQVLAAEQSLAAGEGPGGTQLVCDNSTVSLSASCESPTPSAADDNTSGMEWQSSITPEARTQASITFDLRDDYVLLFGGWNGSSVYGDTWEFVHGNWIALDPTASPAPRWDASMTFDKKDNYVVLFGGHNQTATFSDTWTFEGGVWSELRTGTHPSPRYGAAMAYDSHDGYVVLFGGATGSRSLADTWKFIGGDWTQLYPQPPTLGPSAPDLSLSDLSFGADPSTSSGPRTVGSTPTYPIGRVDAAMAFDNKDNDLVLFGGLNSTSTSSTELNDTWEFQSGKWTYLSEPVAPTPRSQAVFTWDSSDDYTFLFGGANLTAQLDDAWYFVGGIWTRMTATSMASARAGAAGVWDLADLEIVIFSGNEQGLPANIPDTWQVIDGVWNVTKSTPDLSWPQPAARIGAAAVYDYAENHAVYFGGLTQYGTNGETWTYVAFKWHEQFPSIAPSPRSFAGIAYDAKDHYVVLFGGRAANGSALGDTWKWSGYTWTRLAENVSPPARYGAGMTWDNSDDEVLLFGGIGANGQDLSDTWSFSGGEWTNVTPAAGSPSPTARAYPTMANDSRDDVVVLFGGMSGSTLLSDTWTYSGGAWTEITSTTHPSARWGAAAVFDTSNNYFFFFGGCGQAISPIRLQCNDLLNDTWWFVDGKWTKFTPTNSLIPYARAGASIIYDGLYDDRYVLIYSGLVNRTGELLTNERWQFGGEFQLWSPPYYPSPRVGMSGVFEFRDLTIVSFGGYGPLPGGGVGYLDNTWFQDTFRFNEADPAHSPSARAWAAMAWYGEENISSTSYTVLFGGVNQSGYLNDTWYWSGWYVTGDWHHLAETVSPSARSNESLAWDPADGYTLLFGGQNAQGALGDTWKFQNGIWTELFPSVSPAPRANANLVWDYGDGYMVLFGGWNPVTKVAYNDTWRFLGGQWSELSSASGFLPRYGAAAVSVCAVTTTYATCPTLDYVVAMFGGLATNGTYLDDTWTFHAGVWTEHFYHAGDEPLASAFGVVGDDHDDGDYELFSGTNGQGYLDSFWSFATPPF